MWEQYEEQKRQHDDTLSRSMWNKHFLISVRRGVVWWGLGLVERCVGAFVIKVVAAHEREEVDFQVGELFL